MESKDLRELNQEELEQVAGGRLLGGLARPLQLDEIEKRPDLAALLRGALTSDRVEEGSGLLVAPAVERLKTLALDKFGVELADDAVASFVDKAKSLL